MSTIETEHPEVLTIGTDELVIHVTAADSGGRVVAAEVRMPAGGGPPMLHRHAATEIYRVERGELAFYLGAADGTIERRVGGPGTVVHLPGGLEHTIRNEGSLPASAYVVFADGADTMERFAREASALAASGPLQVADVLALAERHGVELTRPVPASS